MKRILVVYALSGFFSLGYQVAWFRIVTDWFGSTNYSFALVVACFIGGLAAGSLSSRWLTRRLTGRSFLGEGLRVYGVVELLVATSILLTLLAGALPADLLGSFPYVERDGIWEQALGYRLFQAVTAGICVFIPTFFMGVTFPLLCDRFAAQPGSGRFPAALYAWNTLGACTGVLLCQFLFLPAIGHVATLWSMAAGNALLGGIFLVADTRTWVGPGDAAVAVEPAAPLQAAASSSPSVSSLIGLVTVGGFLAGGMEGDLFKRITFAIELNPGATMTFISFWAILAIFLASACVNRLPGLRLRHVVSAFALAAIFALGVWPQVDPIMAFVEARVTPVNAAAGPSLEGFTSLQFPTSLLQLWVFTGVLVFPPYFLVSLLLPWVCDRLQDGQRHLGVAYGLNTLAFCVGLLAFVLFAPAVNIFYSLKLFPLVLAVSAAWMWIVSESRPLARWRPAVLAVALVVCAALVPADFDRSFFREGTPPRIQPVRAVKSNGAHTTFVVDAFGSPRLFFGRLQMSGTNLRARTYMRLMAHFPLLLSPKPEKALLICLGVGNTGAAIARHDTIEQIDVIDLNEKIFETAPEFANVNGGLHRDQRVRFIHDDGRNFLRLSDERYDLVTSEPPPPLAAGIYRLYSREYYQEVLEHLTPQGFMSQWLPLFLMTPEAVAMAVDTFVDVFPHAFLFTGYGTDYVLVGSPSPIDWEVLQERFPQLQGEMARLGIRSPESLLARIVQSDAALRRGYGDAGWIRDRHNDLESSLPHPGARPVVALEPDDVLGFLEDIPPESHARLAGIVRHLGRLRHHVQGYPFETLASVDPAAYPDVALADVDWMAIGDLSISNLGALRSRRPSRILASLESFLELSPDQPEVLIQLGIRYLEARDYDRAIERLERFASIEPDDPLGRSLLARAYQGAGR